jgi:hypothetical protein
LNDVDILNDDSSVPAQALDIVGGGMGGGDPEGG